MDRWLRWLDDVDDLCALVWHHSPQAVTTVLLLVAFFTSIGVVFVFGPPDLLAAP